MSNVNFENIFRAAPVLLLKQSKRKWGLYLNIEDGTIGTTNFSDVLHVLIQNS